MVFRAGISTVRVSRTFDVVKEAGNDVLVTALVEEGAETDLLGLEDGGGVGQGCCDCGWVGACVECNCNDCS